MSRLSALLGSTHTVLLTRARPLPLLCGWRRECWVDPSLRCMDYAGVTPRLLALLFGAEDLAADLCVEACDANGVHTAPVAAARSALLIAAAQARVPALDTPWPDPHDPAGLQAEIAAAVRDGFAGKLCIYPDQRLPAEAAFTPSPERVRWATAVSALFAADSDAGVLTLDGKMLDRPHLKLAERIFAAALPD